MVSSRVRLQPLKAHELPSHPDLPRTNAPQATGSELQTFVTSILDDAEKFLTETLENRSVFKTIANDKRSSPATAPIEIRSAVLHKEVEENWFARISVHENAVKAGTASWEEFDGGLRTNHSQHEKEYTPDVQDAHQVLSWSDQTLSVEGWEDVTLEIYEMVHQLPFILKDRAFSVLVATAKRRSEFIVVQIPVDLSGVAKAKYQKDSSVVHGIYVSIEHGELLESGVKWRMGTASDAKGNLPMPLQKPNMPGAVAKDVGLFVAWCEKSRKK